MTSRAGEFSATVRLTGAEIGLHHRWRRLRAVDRSRRGIEAYPEAPRRQKREADGEPAAEAKAERGACLLHRGDGADLRPVAVVGREIAHRGVGDVHAGRLANVNGSPLPGGNNSLTFNAVHQRSFNVSSHSPERNPTDGRVREPKPRQMGLQILQILRGYHSEMSTLLRRGMSRAMLKFARQASLVEQATLRRPAVQGLARACA